MFFVGIFCEDRDGYVMIPKVIRDSISSCRAMYKDYFISQSIQCPTQHDTRLLLLARQSRPFLCLSLDGLPFESSHIMDPSVTSINNQGSRLL